MKMKTFFRFNENPRTYSFLMTQFPHSSATEMKFTKFPN